MNTETLLSIFCQGAGLKELVDEDSICIGTMLPIYSPSGVEKVMQYHTRLIDALLTYPNLSKVQQVLLLSMRGITYHEFVFIINDLTIKETEFGKYPALRCLFFSSNKERKERVIYQFTKDWHGYQKLLAQMLQSFHPSLFAFLFTDEG